MLVCNKSDGTACKDQVRDLCNGLVIDCDKYEKPVKQVKPEKKKRTTTRTKKQKTPG